MFQIEHPHWCLWEWQNWRLWILTGVANCGKWKKHVYSAEFCKNWGILSLRTYSWQI